MSVAECSGCLDNKDPPLTPLPLSNPAGFIFNSSALIHASSCFFVTLNIEKDFPKALADPFFRFRGGLSVKAGEFRSNTHGLYEQQFKAVTVSYTLKVLPCFYLSITSMA